MRSLTKTERQVLAAVETIAKDWPAGYAVAGSQLAELGLNPRKATLKTLAVADLIYLVWHGVTGEALIRLTYSGRRSLELIRDGKEPQI